uniref:Uncharacterized protein n=1 Tax=Cyprinodon variegatus TaxID=28743 RepID=A0A3Q2CFS6_CYPVA
MFGLVISKDPFLIRSSWIGFLLLHVVVCAPVKQGGTGAGSGVPADLGFNKDPGLTGGLFSGLGAATGGGSSAVQDEPFSTMIESLLSLGPSKTGLQQSLWVTSDHVPVSMTVPRPVFPISYVIHTSNGYKRARNNQFNSKYVQGAFEDSVQPGTPQNPGSGQKMYTDAD